MGMRIEKTVVVNAPADAVWAFLTDPQRVASCLPGAAITGQLDEQTWGGTMNVKVGPVTASYRGKMKFERLDPAAREAEIAATGQETRGKGAADMRMTSRVIERGPAETEVVIVSDVNVVGVLAQFGKGMIEDVSDQMFGKFSAAMRRQLETAAPAPAAAAAAEGVGMSSPSPAVPSVAVTADASVAPPIPKATVATPPTTSPRVSEEVLDLGAIGSAAAGRAAARALRNPVLWIAVVLALHLLWHLLQ